VPVSELVGVAGSPRRIRVEDLAAQLRHRHRVGVVHDLDDVADVPAAGVLERLAGHRRSGGIRAGHLRLAAEGPSHVRLVQGELLADDLPDVQPVHLFGVKPDYSR